MSRGGCFSQCRTELPARSLSTIVIVNRNERSLHWPSRAVGVVATLLLHAAFFQSLTLGSLTSKRVSKQEETGPGATAILSSEGTFMTLVIVHLPSPREDASVATIASRGVAVSNPIIQITSPDPLPLSAYEEAMEEENGEASHTAGDPAMQSLLFGRYTGQIDARIQRAWHKPHVAIDGAVSGRGDSDQAVRQEPFHCQARIQQDQDGNVTEIELMQCNGSPAWQLSLVRAIQRASPLPAPPHPSVFTTALTLAFETNAYASGSRGDDYDCSTDRIKC